MATSSQRRRFGGSTGPGDRAVQAVPLRQLLGMSVASCRGDRSAQDLGALNRAVVGTVERAERHCLAQLRLRVTGIDAGLTATATDEDPKSVPQSQ
jgi:hypothetical protein